MIDEITNVRFLCAEPARLGNFEERGRKLFDESLWKIFPQISRKVGKSGDFSKGWCFVG